jgi:integral membrane protein
VFRTPLTLFRTLAIAEAVSWTLLIAGLILRATADLPLAVTIGGGIHGFVFLAYGATAVLVALNQRWSLGPTVVAIVSAVIPYATVPTEVWLKRTGRLRGEWRLEASDDPRDQRPLDRLLRFFLRRPWVLGILILVAVALIFVVLLVVGPPGGKG